MNDCYDSVVIGAGAAGIAAGRHLAKSGVSFRILEARSRIGGRAFTQSVSGFPIDRGCGWLHSADRNVWREIAANTGFTVDQTLPHWGEQALDRGLSKEEQDDFAKAWDALEHRFLEPPDTGPDQAASHLLEPGLRWNPLLNAVSTYMSGAELNYVSALDLSRYTDTGVNWRVREGYGAAIAAYGATLPVTLDCAVRQIDHSGPQLRLDTTQGVLSTRTVIVTIPPTLLLSGGLRFRPELPDKQRAAEGLPLGVANKLILSLDEPEDMPIEGHLFGRIDRTETASYHLRPFGRPLIECYFGGALARTLEAKGPDAFFAFACDELTELMGSAFAKRLHFLTATSWALDPLAGGSYSFAHPGHADARQTLAQSIDNRLFFAGEACSPHFFSTAHGAYETGHTAAVEVLAALSPEMKDNA
jgi:monoamine oxidase